MPFAVMTALATLLVRAAHMQLVSPSGTCRPRRVGTRTFNAVLASRLARVAFLQHDDKGHDALNTMWPFTGYTAKAEAYIVSPLAHP